MLPVMNAGCCAHDPQERRGWLILLVAFLADALGLGGRGLFSFMILYFEAEFGWDGHCAGESTPPRMLAETLHPYGC